VLLSVIVLVSIACERFTLMPRGYTSRISLSRIGMKKGAYDGAKTPNCLTTVEQLQPFIPSLSS
jgi:hypothetical protein